MSERLEKLERIKKLGINPFPEKYERTHKSLEALALAENDGVRDTEIVLEKPRNEIKLCGRMMTFRSHGKLSFAQLQDVSGRIQICFIKNKSKVEGLNSDEITHYKFIEKLVDLGDHIGVTGELFKTNHGEITLFVDELTFLGKALRDLPEKFHGVTDQETIYRQRYLDLLMNTDSMKRFKMRSDVIRIIRNFLWKNEFYEIESPSLEHAATGAAAKPYLTHNNALDLDLVLRISQELPLKKLIIGGYDRIFEIGKAFRNEGIDPSHLPEHTHFEWSVAYWSYRENMDLTEKLIKYVIDELKISPVIPIKDKDGKVKNVDFSKKWERINFVDLIKNDSGIDIMEFKDVESLRKEIASTGIKIVGMETMAYATLVDYLYKKVSRPKIIGPAFLYNYPKALQPLARVNDENPEMVDQFQLLINGWEIVKGYSELVDPVDQKDRFIEQEKALFLGDEEAMKGDDEYIVAMEYGMPPISGVGLGLDRFITLLLQQDNLRDCVLFPLMKPTHERTEADTAEVFTLKVDDGLGKYENVAVPPRDQAWKLVPKYAKETSFQHLQMVEIAMRTLAKKFGQDEDMWGTVGLLHDIDWDILPEDAKTHDSEKMIEILKEIDLDDLLIEAVISHDPSQGIPADDLLKKCIRSVDELVGFIGAVSKVRPDKKIATVKVKSVTKKIKDKSFAANVSREHLKYCEELLDIPVAEFIQILLDGLKPRAEEFGL